MQLLFSVALVFVQSGGVSAEVASLQAQLKQVEESRDVATAQLQAARGDLKQHVARADDAQDK